MHTIVTWMEDLLMQKKDGNPVHHIQSFQIVNCYQPHVSAGYMGIVLCNHSQHEIAEEIVQEMTEKSTLFGEDIDEQSTTRETTEQSGTFSNCEDG